MIIILQGLRVAQAAVTTLAVKSRKTAEKNRKKKKLTPQKYLFCIYLLVMPKYWVTNYFAHERFPEVGQKQKTEKKRRGEIERKTERWY